MVVHGTAIGRVAPRVFVAAVMRRAFELLAGHVDHEAAGIRAVVERLPGQRVIALADAEKVADVKWSGLAMRVTGNPDIVSGAVETDDD